MLGFVRLDSFVKCIFAHEWVLHRNYLLVYRLRGDEIQLLQIWHVARQTPT